MATRKLWGELEDDSRDENLQNVNFAPIIELGMQNIPEIPITVKSSPIELPKPNLVTHTIQLQAYASQLKGILGNTNSRTISEDPRNVPEIPPLPEECVKVKHEVSAGFPFLEKKYTDFSLGRGPVILPFTEESHKRALKQCAATAIAHVGILHSTNTALNTLTDSLDMFMSSICKVLRVVVDKEASGVKCGYPDAVSRVFADLDFGNLHEFYDIHIVQFHAHILNKCRNLKAQCEEKVIDIPPQLKLDDVPELHFPAALDSTFTPSLETGFQMLQNLEQEQLEGLEFIELIGQDQVKLDNMDFSHVQPEPTTKPSSSSPGAKKKRIN